MLKIRRTPRAILATGLAIGLLGTLVACSGSEAPGDEPASTKVLTIGGWGGGFTKATQQYLADPFSAETGIDVQFADAPGEQVARLKAMTAANNIEWDLIDSLDASSAAVAYASDLAAPMPGDVRKRLEAILPAESISEYGIYFSNNAFVIGCNEDVATACPSNAKEFFDTKNFPGPRAFIDRPLIAITMALEADGVDIASATTVDLDRALAKLESIKKDITVWYSAGDQMEQVVRDGQVAMGVLWSGRSYRLIEQGVNLKLSWDGAVYDPGEWFVVAGSPNEAAAWEFIIALADNAKGQADWSTAMTYGLANPKAFDFMDPKVAATLPDWPENFKSVVIPNFGWYAANLQDVETRWMEFLAQ